MVLDELARRMSGGRQSCDRDGRLAVAGRVNETLLAELLAAPALRAPPPRSLGREQYGAEFCDALLAQAAPADKQDWCDLLATMSELSARAVAQACREHVAPVMRVEELVASGGGVRNPDLMRRLAVALAPVPVVASDERGLSSDYKEAIAFALLASARIDRVAGNVPEVTGARRPVLLGKITEC